MAERVSRRRRVKSSSQDENENPKPENIEDKKPNKIQQVDNNETIEEEIKELPKDDPKTTEGRIREIYEKIQALDDEGKKQQLEDTLKKAACLGISEKLNKLMYNNGLSFEYGLALVLKSLTDIPRLADYVHETSDKDKLREDGMEIVSEKLGSELSNFGVYGIRKEIAALQKDDPKTAEGRIRQLHEKIQAIDDEGEKQKLEVTLKDVAGLGLSKELNELMHKNGLSLEYGLALVLNNLTDIPHLAQYLKETQKDKLKKDGLEIVSRKLGPELSNFCVYEIRIEIEAMLKDDPKTAEGKIREIHEKIQALGDDKQKQQLNLILKNSACHGLSGDLKELLDRKGLTLEALVLVLNYLTDIPDLAQHLYETEKDELEEGLKLINRKLGPELEVHGGLKSKQIDTSKEEWAKNLIQKAPSFSELSRLSLSEWFKEQKGVTERERKVVDELIEVVKSLQRDSAFPPDKRLAKQNDEKKKEQAEKLKQSKALMKEAQDLALKALEQNKGEINQRMKELSKKLELPPDWYNQDKMSAEDALMHINDEISKFEEYIETRPAYDSLEEVVAKASGGLALTGVYYSTYNRLVTAGLPILKQPAKVESKNAEIPYESEYKKFNKEGAAAQFAKEVQSSGFDVATSVSAHVFAFTASAEAAYGSQNSRTSSHKSTTQGTSASVSHHIRIGTQAFQIGRDEMKLRMDARQKALAIVDELENDTDEKQKDAARHFFRRYGSHMPCGTHNLGGIFFTITNAHSEGETDVATLATAAVQHLHTKVSVGYEGGIYGGGASVSYDSHSEKGESKGDQKENKSVSYTYSIKSIGPNADNQATFKKLLSKNNSTWAILDRGDFSAYVPVWEFFQELGGPYEKPAKVMKQTWDEDEKKHQERQRDRELKYGDCLQDGSVIQLKSRASGKTLMLNQNGSLNGNGPLGLDVGSKVWALWKDNIYYHGKVTDVGYRIYVDYDDGDKVDYDLNDLSTIIPDNIPDSGAPILGARVIADYKENGKKYYPGTVREIKEGHYKIHYDDGGEDSVKLEGVRLIPAARSPEKRAHFKVINLGKNGVAFTNIAYPEYFLGKNDIKMAGIMANLVVDQCQFKVHLSSSLKYIRLELCNYPGEYLGVNSDGTMIPLSDTSNSDEKTLQFKVKFLYSP